MKTQTKESQALLNPILSLKLLKKGNQRFVDGLKAKRNLNIQVTNTSQGQYPFATILSCIDSRVPAELVFDQGIGDIFSIRIAGNFVNEDILGSMEFACKLAGTKIIVVLGHTSCGAIKGACDNAKLGNLTNMLSKIKPAVNNVKLPEDPTLRTSKNLDFVNAVAKQNIFLSINKIRKESPVLAEMEDYGEIKIIGAIYDINTGKVNFY